MTQTAARAFDDQRPDIVDGTDRYGLRVDAVPVAVVGRVRSPILDDHPVAAPADPVTDLGAAPSLGLPFRALVAPATIVLVVAGPLLVLTTWQVAVAATVLVLAMRVLQQACDTRGITFGGGFLAYRPDARWPHGVQEEDDVRWHWTGRGAPTQARR